MNADDHQAVRRLLSSFAERPIEVLDPMARADRRMRSISGIQAVLSESPASYRQAAKAWGRWSVAGAGLALAAGVVLGVGHWARSRDLGSSIHLRAFAARGSILCSTDEKTAFEACNPSERSDLTGIRALDGASVQVETHVGARIALEPLTSVVLTKGAQRPHSSRVQLLEGRIAVTVPKLEAGHEFVVQAPTASITVHGTAFTVTVTPRRIGAPATCVELREGIVTVASDKSERLVAPARWGCDSNSSLPALLPGEHSERAGRLHPTVSNLNEPGGAAAGAREPSSDRYDRSRRKSSLAQETKLLQLGLGAEQRKDLASAEKHYRALLKHYPDSVVAPEARAALERIDGKKSTK